MGPSEEGSRHVTGPPPDLAKEVPHMDVRVVPRSQPYPGQNGGGHGRGYRSYAAAAQNQGLTHPGNAVLRLQL